MGVIGRDEKAACAPFPKNLRDGNAWDVFWSETIMRFEM